MPVRDGLRQQRLCAVPRRQVTAALGAPVTRRLVVTDAGYSPAAAGHQARRPAGSRQTLVVICAGGSGWAEVNGMRHRIGSSAALVIPSGAPHAYGGSPSSPWTIWWCHLRGSDVPELVGAMGASTIRPVVPIRHLDRAVALADEIVSRLERDESPGRLVGVAGAAWKLVTQLIADQTDTERDDPLDRAMRYLAERLDSTVPVPELAALVGVSASHLTTLFRRATGGGVHAHQTTLRMAKARRLLATTSATISEIAHDVGYADPFHFSRQFRQLHEMSPTEYRRRTTHDHQGSTRP